MKKLSLISALLLPFLIGACTSYIQREKSNRLPSAMEIKADYKVVTHYKEHRAQQHILKTSVGDIAYTDHGQGEVIVLLHGVPTSSWMYRKVIPVLQHSKRVITIDFLGYGSSDKPRNQNNIYKPRRQADYVSLILSTLGIQKYTLVFHDMGGLVAWQLLKRDIQSQEHNIEKIFILNTIISKKGFNHPKWKKGFFAKQMANAYSMRLTSRKILDMTFNNMGLTNNKQLSEEECAGYVIPMREGSNLALYDFFTGFTPEFFSNLETHINLLKDYQGQAYILWGKQDKVLTMEQLPQLKKVLSIDKEFIFNENSHFLLEEIPDTISQIILNH